VLLVGCIVGLALGHVDVGLGAIILGGISLAAFFGAWPAGAGICSQEGRAKVCPDHPPLRRLS
jgi:hypothetical protein